MASRGDHGKAKHAMRPRFRFDTPFEEFVGGRPFVTELVLQEEVHVGRLASFLSDMRRCTLKSLFWRTTTRLCWSP